MQNRLHWKLLLGTILFLSLPAVARAAFIPGDVLYVANKSAYNIRNGGSFAAAKPLASLPDIVLGQSAFDLNLDAAYISQTQLGEILKVTSDGVVSVFAQVPHGNFGMIRTRDGRLLSTIGGGRVADISPGGNLTSVTPFATGLGFTRGMLQTSDGRILIASQDTGKVFDITSGGDFSNATPFASGLDSAASLVEDATRRIFVSQFTLGRVTDITAGGNFSTATAFATGRSFMGLTIDGQGRMLASPIGSVALPGSVYDITAGGNFQFAPAFATGVTSGETSITTAPCPSLRSPSPQQQACCWQCCCNAVAHLLHALFRFPLMIFRNPAAISSDRLIPCSSAYLSASVSRPRSMLTRTVVAPCPTTGRPIFARASCATCSIRAFSAGGSALPTGLPLACARRAASIARLCLAPMLPDSGRPIGLIVGLAAPLGLGLLICPFAF